jgi:hypothetical protein
LRLVIVLDAFQVIEHEVEDVLKIIYAFRCAGYLAEIIKLDGATAHTANILQCMGWGEDTAAFRWLNADTAQKIRQYALDAVLGATAL